jgi:hypothetical protein
MTQLITRLKQGDRDAAQGLWRAFFPRLVAGTLGCVEQTVECKLRSIRSLWLAEGPG